MATLLLTLGPGLEADSHGDALVIDFERKRIVEHARYDHRVYEQSHKGLSGAGWRDGRLLVAAEAEVLVATLAPLRIVESHTFPFLNDVHFAVSTPTRHWICNTGLDSLEEMDRDWNVVATHDLIRPFGRSPAHVRHLLWHDAVKSFRRFQEPRGLYQHLGHRPPFRNVIKLAAPTYFRRRNADLRHYDFRPHVLHPNHVLPIGDDIWVTLLLSGQIVSLKTRRVLADGLGRPHDGFAFEDEFFVTDCERNRLLVYRLDRDAPALGPRLREQTLTGQVSEGFLRGVAIVGERVYVGLSARRGAPPAMRVARVRALDRRSLDVLDEWNVPAEYGSGLYSVVDVSAAY